ncbi:MAG: hypothetical protein NTY67_09180 [Cyanobacteria bacterium]|nr:hypothetical protein [Cyanobacteriota bacterium]
MLFACNVLSGILPIRLIDAGWQLNAIQSLQNLAFLPLLGTCLLLLGADPDDTGSGQRLGLIRKGAGLACIGFLLLIPLQAAGTWRLGILAEVPANRTISTIAAARSEIASSRDFSELGTSLLKLPGAPKLPPGFNQPLSKVRQGMERRLATDLENLRNSQQQRIAQRRLPELLLFCRTLIINLVFATVFGAIAGFTLSRPRFALKLANPFTQLSIWIENSERRREAQRRSFQVSGTKGPLDSIVKGIQSRLKHMQRRGEARRLASRTESSRRQRSD